MSFGDQQLISKKQLYKRTVLSFVVFIVMLACAVAAWNWLRDTQKDNGVAKPLRAVLNTNEKILTNYVFSDSNLSKKYSVSDAVKHVRVNGDLGLDNSFDPTLWKLQVVRKPGDTLFLSLDDIKALPKTDVIFDFKCIEGWSQITHWAGVRFSDFVKKYDLHDDVKLNYAGLNTPDKGYYVGIDMKSMMQPQTILCYEMNGEPLPMNQGYPLRLIIPVKYGIKHLKRIGTIFFSNERPPDYWYEKGYDYYSGL